jgi:hypothetical protein
MAQAREASASERAALTATVASLEQSLAKQALAFCRLLVLTSWRCSSALVRAEFVISFNRHEKWVEQLFS